MILGCLCNKSPKTTIILCLIVESMFSWFKNSRTNYIYYLQKSGEIIINLVIVKIADLANKLFLKSFNFTYLQTPMIKF